MQLLWRAGYSGRVGVFEVLTATAEQRKLIAAGASGQELRAQALIDGMIPLRRAGMLLAQQGITTVEEVLRNVFFIS